MVDHPPETTEQPLTRRQRYFHALGVHGTQHLVPLLEAADSDDLRWMVRILELKLNERPSPGTDPESLKRSTDDLRRKRLLAISRLSNLEVYEKQTGADRRHGGLTREAAELARILVRRP